MRASSIVVAVLVAWFNIEARAERPSPLPTASIIAARPLPADGRVRTTAEYFATLDQRFRPEAAKGVDAVFQFELSGAEACAYIVTVREAQVTVARGVAAQSNVTIKMNGSDYVKVVNGEMSGSAAFMRGAMRSAAASASARKLSQLFPAGALKTHRNNVLATRK